MDTEFKYCPICGHRAEYTHEPALKTWSIQCSNPECVGRHLVLIKDFYFKQNAKTVDKNQKTADELYLASINLGMKLISQLSPENRAALEDFLVERMIDALCHYEQKAGV